MAPKPDPVLVDWAQVVGAAVGAVAIVVAVYALWRQRRDLRMERKAQYELGLLRDLVRLIGEPHGYLEARVLMSMFYAGLHNLQEVQKALDAIQSAAKPPQEVPQEDEASKKIWLARRPAMLKGVKAAADYRVHDMGRRWRS